MVEVESLVANLSSDVRETAGFLHLTFRKPTIPSIAPAHSDGVPKTRAKTKDRRLP